MCKDENGIESGCTDDCTTTTNLQVRPTCDLCSERPAYADGATRLGPWAYMCVPCFEVYGVGLGLGKGQRIKI